MEIKWLADVFDDREFSPSNDWHIPSVPCIFSKSSCGGIYLFYSAGGKNPVDLLN